MADSKLGPTLDHARVVQYESELPYKQRNYVLAKIDDRHFEALVEGSHDLALNGYCLDALELLPAGCMVQGWRHPRQLCVRRGTVPQELREREAAFAQLIAEIIEDEA